MRWQLEIAKFTRRLLTAFFWKITALMMNVCIYTHAWRISMDTHYVSIYTCIYIHIYIWHIAHADIHSSAQETPYVPFLPIHTCIPYIHPNICKECMHTHACAYSTPTDPCRFLCTSLLGKRSFLNINVARTHHVVHTKRLLQEKL